MPVPTLEEYKARTRKSWEGRPRQKENTTRYRLGPEFPGCFNTGMRPALMSLKYNGETFWFVGPELEVRDNYLNMKIGRKASIGKGSRKVIMRSTRAAAESHFWMLCALVLDDHRETERKREEARRLASTGNFIDALQAANILSNL